MKTDFYQQTFPNLHMDGEYQLREQSLDDTSAFYEYYSAPDVSQYILAASPNNLTDAMNEIHYCRNLFYHKSGVYWSIARKSDNRMIGAIGLYINRHHNRAEICYDLHKDYWRKGIMSRAIKAVMDFAFNEIDLARIEAVTVKENIASMGILKKLGYVYEGTLRNYRQYNNQAHDIEMFGITPDLYKSFLKEKETADEMEPEVLEPTKT